MPDFSCLLTAIFTLVGNSLLVAYYAVEQDRANWDQYQYSQLNPDFLKQNWEWREDSRQLEVAGKMITAVSWVIMTAPILHLCVVSSLGGDRQFGLHVTIVCICMGAAITEVTAQLMHLGTFNAAQWMTKEFQLDNWMGPSSGDAVGWQSLEVSYRETVALTLWVDSIEYLALVFMFIMIFWSIYSMGDLPQSVGMGLAGFAVFIGILSLADFIAYVLRFKFWASASKVGRIISVLNRVIFIPMWFLILSCKLHAASAAHEQDELTKREGITMPVEGDEKHLD